MPTLWATAAMDPRARPPRSVWRSTTASEGPGDIAPSAQIAATEIQVVSTAAVYGSSVAIRDRAGGAKRQVLQPCHHVSLTSYPVISAACMQAPGCFFPSAEGFVERARFRHGLCISDTEAAKQQQLHPKTEWRM